MARKMKHSGKHMTHGHKMYGSEGHIDAHVSTQGKGKDKMNDHMHTKHNMAHGLPGDMFGHDGDSYGHGHGKELSHAHESEVSEGGHTAGSSMADNYCYEDASKSGKGGHGAKAMTSADDESYEND